MKPFWRACFAAHREKCHVFYVIILRHAIGSRIFREHRSIGREGVSADWSEHPYWIPLRLWWFTTGVVMMSVKHAFCCIRNWIMTEVFSISILEAESLNKKNCGPLCRRSMTSLCTCYTKKLLSPAGVVQKRHQIVRDITCLFSLDKRNAYLCRLYLHLDISQLVAIE